MEAPIRAILAGQKLAGSGKRQVMGGQAPHEKDILGRHGTWNRPRTCPSLGPGPTQPCPLPPAGSEYPDSLAPTTALRSSPAGREGKASGSEDWAGASGRQHTPTIAQAFMSSGCGA